ncbi:DNA adenine methylase [Paenibacillus sp. FSL E2-8871]|uniref:DNA adenine methylase n=1 Tax=Paenibacillus sp. FSL E2-8871 TaxID=2975326 RepID=UPI0030F7BA92
MKTNVEFEWWKDLDLNYSGENNFASFFSSGGNIHTYPAKAVPDMILSLLKKLKEQYGIKKVLDPFMGSGTVALEARYLGLDFYGSDLNPLSILLSRTKALTVNNAADVEKALINFSEKLIITYADHKLVDLVYFEKINFWFKSKNIQELSFIKAQCDKFLGSCPKKNRETYALILLTAFSSTIRESSLTRNNEFKLYRMSPNDVEKFEIDSLLVFKEKVSNLMSMLVEANKDSYNKALTEIKMQNAKDLSVFYNKKIDLILTSPPYGDSQSTVAYGEFSKLSLQWSKDLLAKYLDIRTQAENVDEHLLGGKKSLSSISLKMILRRSNTFKELFKTMRDTCKIDIKDLINAKISLNIMQDNIEKGVFEFQYFEGDNIVFELLKERTRLEYFRKLNAETTLKNREVKKSAISMRDEFFEQLRQEPQNEILLDEIINRIPAVRETINRRIKAIPRRIKSVIHFFKELYLVVEQTDKVLDDQGIQAWIVGHRTVLGSITVDMAGILNDWFVSLGYNKITTLHRQYSFKRLPHHINSTITRKNEIKTMMQEHIIVVRKNVSKDNAIIMAE